MPFRVSASALLFVTVAFAVFFTVTVEISGAVVSGSKVYGSEATLRLPARSRRKVRANRDSHGGLDVGQGRVDLVDEARLVDALPVSGERGIGIEGRSVVRVHHAYVLREEGRGEGLL